MNNHISEIFQRIHHTNAKNSPIINPQEHEEISVEPTLEQLLALHQKARQGKAIKDIKVEGIATDSISYRESRGQNEAGDETLKKEYSYTAEGVPITDISISKGWILKCPFCERIITKNNVFRCRTNYHPVCVFCSEIVAGHRYCFQHSTRARVKAFATFLFGPVPIPAREINTEIETRILPASKENVNGEVSKELDEIK